MKRFRLSVFIVFVLSQSSFASGPLFVAVQQAESTPPTRLGSYPDTYFFKYCTDQLSGFVYDDLQCENLLPAETIVARAVFSAEGSNRLVYVMCDAECGNLITGKLYLSNTQGFVLDALDVYVDGLFCVIKNFVIEDSKIKVYSIKPTSSESLSFWNFGSSFTGFEGERCDEEYLVEGFNFRLAKRVKYLPKNYTYEEIYDEEQYTFKIWDGGEIVSDVQVF